MMANKTLGAYNIFDLRDLARKRVPKFLFEYIDRGTEDEVALRNNRAAFERIKLKPRTLVDVSQRSQEITLFGEKQKMPIAIAPTGTAGLMWYEGEIALARAAKTAGIPFTLATSSLTAMEKVAERVGGRLWFQLYSMWPDKTLSYELVERAHAAGYEALIFTVDSIVLINAFRIAISGKRGPVMLNIPSELLDHRMIDYAPRPPARYQFTIPLRRRNEATLLGNTCGEDTPWRTTT